MQKVKLGDISKLNAETFKNNFNKIYYLDTSSVTKGRFEKYSVFENGAKIPSRAKRAVKDKTIVYSTVRPNLKHFGILKEPSENIVVSTGFTTIDVKNFVDAKYIYYFLTQNSLTNKLDTIASNNVSSYPSIKPSDLENIELALPTLLVQQKISKVLSNIDDKIELNYKINMELEQMARQIYEYWFLQFDFPDENGNPYKSSGGKMVQSNILKREIPIEWEVKELKDILVNITDKSEKIRSENILNDGIFPVITQDKGEIIKGYTNNKKPIKINPLLIFGDHSCTLKYVDFPFFRGADGTQILNFSNDKLTRYCYFSIQKFLPQIPNFGKYERHFKYLKAMPIVLPSIKVLNNFDGFAKSIFKKIEHNNIEIYNLEKQRDYLLPMLMNGQINVDNIQVN
ncbi:restriction endonuclease subunit S [Lactococcus lactis]|jgi:type I restriction enzyme S subunit|uniref:restriction endonuclease subunit S n=1 Tax=Lactococcus lactis TaxID=1358 RepID=UPI0018A8C71A|nr:restriction endonuclease subunit S [Lactococcus lactis]